MFLTERQLRLLFKAVLYESNGGIDLGKFTLDLRKGVAPEKTKEDTGIVDPVLGNTYFTLYDAEELSKKIQSSMDTGETGFGQEFENVVVKALNKIDEFKKLNLTPLNGAEHSTSASVNFSWADIMSGLEYEFEHDSVGKILSVKNPLFSLKATRTTNYDDPFSANNIKTSSIFGSGNDNTKMIEQLISKWVELNPSNKRSDVGVVKLRLGCIGMICHDYNSIDINSLDREMIAKSIVDDMRIKIYIGAPPEDYNVFVTRYPLNTGLKEQDLPPVISLPGSLSGGKITRMFKGLINSYFNAVKRKIKDAIDNHNGVIPLEYVDNRMIKPDVSGGAYFNFKYDNTTNNSKGVSLGLRIIGFDVNLINTLSPIVLLNLTGNGKGGGIKDVVPYSMKPSYAEGANQWLSSQNVNFLDTGTKVMQYATSPFQTTRDDHYEKLGDAYNTGDPDVKKFIVLELFSRLYNVLAPGIEEEDKKGMEDINISVVYPAINNPPDKQQNISNSLSNIYRNSNGRVVTKVSTNFKSFCSNYGIPDSNQHVINVICKDAGNPNEFIEYALSKIKDNSLKQKIQEYRNNLKSLVFDKNDQLTSKLLELTKLSPQFAAYLKEIIQTRNQIDSGLIKEFEEIVDLFAKYRFHIAMSNVSLEIIKEAAKMTLASFNMKQLIDNPYAKINQKDYDDLIDQIKNKIRPFPIVRFIPPYDHTLQNLVKENVFVGKDAKLDLKNIKLEIDNYIATIINHYEKLIIDQIIDDVDNRNYNSTAVIDLLNEKKDVIGLFFKNIIKMLDEMIPDEDPSDEYNNNTIIEDPMIDQIQESKSYESILRKLLYKSVK